MDEDESYKPQTIKEVIDRCTVLDGAKDLELAVDLAESKLDWLYANLKDLIIRAGELKNNPVLLNAYEAKTPEEAAMVITREIWKSYNLRN